MPLIDLSPADPPVQPADGCPSLDNQKNSYPGSEDGDRPIDALGQQVALATLYGKGRGVPHDDAMAAHWMRQAAEVGHVNGQGNLGVMFEHGDGVPRDLVEAYTWETLAASRPTIDRDRLHWTETRDHLRARLPPDQLDRAEGAARDWMAAFSNRQQR